MTLGRIIITRPRCLLGKTFYNLSLLQDALSALTWVGEFLVGGLNGQGEIKRSEASFH